MELQGLYSELQCQTAPAGANCTRIASRRSDRSADRSRILKINEVELSEVTGRRDSSRCHWLCTGATRPQCERFECKSLPEKCRRVAHPNTTRRLRARVLVERRTGAQRTTSIHPDAQKRNSSCCSCRQSARHVSMRRAPFCARSAVAAASGSRAGGSAQCVSKRLALAAAAAIPTCCLTQRVVCYSAKLVCSFPANARLQTSYQISNLSFFLVYKNEIVG